MVLRHTTRSCRRRQSTWNTMRFDWLVSSFASKAAVNSQSIVGNGFPPRLEATSGVAACLGGNRLCRTELVPYHDKRWHPEIPRDRRMTWERQFLSQMVRQPLLSDQPVLLACFVICLRPQRRPSTIQVTVGICGRLQPLSAKKSTSPNDASLADINLRYLPSADFAYSILRRDPASEPAVWQMGLQGRHSDSLIRLNGASS